MNISNIIKFDTGNARGLSTVVFVSGCEHHCAECQNPETWFFDYGAPLEDKIQKIIEALDNPHIRNLVISGGDPLNPKNLDGTFLIIAATAPVIRDRKQNIIIYTGYTFKQLQNRRGEEKEKTSKILEYVDYIIDGLYDRNKKPKGLDYRGSYNQRCWKRGDLGWFDISDSYFRELSLDDKIRDLEREGLTNESH